MIKALAKDGRVVRLKTDDSQPDGWESIKLRSCPIGHALRQQGYGEDRLKYPMGRKHWEPLTGGDKSLRGRDEWVHISWDEALDYVAAELGHAKKEYGNRSILYMNDTKTDIEMAKELAARLDIDTNGIFPKTEEQLWFEQMAGVSVIQEDGSFKPVVTMTEEGINRYNADYQPQEGEIGFEELSGKGARTVTRAEGDRF